ncbi:alkaline phosphatase family protein [Bythopirellula polymerisocia]|nr:alkaline phosphatase family protein [Bythopirellula polymerisocia]
MLSRSASAVIHVIHISVDGLRVDLLEANINTSPLDHPKFKRFVDEGATTFNARTDYTYTNTLPNHTSMLTGRPVEQPVGATNTTHHGYTSDGTFSDSSTLHDSGNPNLPYVSSIFDVVHDNGLSTALYASKDKFSLYVQSYSTATGALDITGPDNGRDKIGTHLITEEFGIVDSNLVSLMHTNYLSDMAANEYNYSFLHYALPDSIGHSGGWESESWNSSVELIDGYLGDVFDLVEVNPIRKS